MVLSTRASKVVRMGLRGLMVRFSTFLDAPRRALVPGLPERIAAVKRKTGDNGDDWAAPTSARCMRVDGAHNSHCPTCTRRTSRPQWEAE